MELSETKDAILEVSKELRRSTKKLMRQLKDNPDVQGNSKLIKDHKNNLCAMTESIMDEMRNDLYYTKFKKEVDYEIEK